MAKDMKTRKGKDNVYYPYTSPDLVIDSAGESQTTKNTNMKNDIQLIKDSQIILEEDETSMEGMSDNEYPTLTTTDKTLIGSINEVNAQYKDIANEKVKHVNFPKLESDLSDSERIQRAIDFACKNNKTEVFLNYNETYVLKKGLELKNNISLRGLKSTLTRQFNRTIGYAMIKILGNCEISDIIIDGGSDNISVDIQNEEYINYSDLWVAGDNVDINNCIFDKSCGSSIVYKGCNNINIHNNIFNSFLDHSIYGRNTDLITNGINIYSNIFNEDSNSRCVIKNATNINNVNIFSNNFNTPNSCVFVCESGCKNHNYYANNGNCTDFFECTSKDIKIDNINIFNNNFTIVSRITKLYKVPENTTQFGTCIGKLKIFNNYLVLKNTIGNTQNNRCILINGDIDSDGIDSFVFSGNTVYMPNQRPQLFWLFGKIKNITIKNNTFNSEYSTSDIYSNSLINFHLHGINSTFSQDYNGKIIFTGNEINGNISPLLKDEATSSENSYCKFDVVIDRNIFDTGTTFRLTQTTAQNASTLSKKIYLGKNLEINGNEITKGNWNNSNIIVY